jgi:hypothetical protein
VVVAEAAPALMGEPRTRIVEVVEAKEYGTSLQLRASSP